MTYLHSHTKSFNLADPSYGCGCHCACAPGDVNCACIRKNGCDFPYTGHGVLMSRKPLLYERGPSCPCIPNCKNRVSQTSLKVQLKVLKTGAGDCANGIPSDLEPSYANMLGK